MTAGLPGTGIGGLFYLTSALCMPLRELYLTCRGRSSKKRWKLVGTQISFALGVVAGFCATGWWLNCMLPVKQILTLHGSGRALNVLAVKPFFVSISVLAGVLVIIEIFSLFSRLTPKRRSLRRKTLENVVKVA